MYFPVDSAPFNIAITVAILTLAWLVSLWLTKDYINLFTAICHAAWILIRVRALYTFDMITWPWVLEFKLLSLNCLKWSKPAPKSQIISLIFDKCSILKQMIWPWNHTSHTKIFFIKFVANALRDKIGIVIFDLQPHKGC